MTLRAHCTPVGDALEKTGKINRRYEPFMRCSIQLEQRVGTMAFCYGYQRVQEAVQVKDRSLLGTEIRYDVWERYVVC